MTAHTPGPWTVEEYGDEDCPALVIHKDSESRVCFMATPGSHGDPAKIEADAHLIAAAPELLAVCRKAKKYLEPDLVEPGRTVFWALVEAIKKAEGGTLSHPDGTGR